MALVNRGKSASANLSKLIPRIVTPISGLRSISTSRNVQLHLMPKQRISRSAVNSFARIAAVRYSSSFPPHTIIRMPALSPTMTQGNIGKWNKKPGDPLQPGDVLVEVETDKAQMDFESQDEGFIAQVLLNEGEKDVPVNTPIAVLVESEDLVPAFADFKASDVAGSEGASSKSEAAATAPAESTAGTENTSFSTPTSSSSSSTPPPKGDRVIASPLAKNVAGQKGIPLQEVQGTGPGGRIIKADVDAFKPTSTTFAAPSPVASSAAAYEDIPLSNIRKVIATRLTQSKSTVPHYYLTSEIKMDKLLKLRELLNKEANGAYKLSVNDFVIKAASKALIDVPDVNSAWQDTFIRQFKSADIAVAVATDTGLITPIVNSADTKGLASISNSVKDLAARAKIGKLAPHEYQGGTFTISNMGMFGIDHFTAIINPPHAGILAVGATTEKLVVDESSEKGFSAEKVMKVTLSADHRVADGAVGAKWLLKFKGYIENPLTLLL